jgi:hypothetical protein
LLGRGKLLADFTGGALQPFDVRGRDAAMDRDRLQFADVRFRLLD